MRGVAHGLSSLGMTKHALERAAQRGVSQQDLKLLITYAKYNDAGAGCSRLYLNDQAVQELIADGLPLEVVESAQKSEAIVTSDGRVVTCYRRTRGDRRRRVFPDRRLVRLRRR
ncbi:hypothetical protein RUA4292_00590 [Ruegeria atlantica]|uniref:DUF4258 domain-containing protein n=1 Tax=Ruegeria atlantica TaxID=81569 RepID=A0A0P1EAL9_9RHOB|nr:hypothetical protein RUA4292_00590 [Ruegeria atlantica]